MKSSFAASLIGVKKLAWFVAVLMALLGTGLYVMGRFACWEGFVVGICCGIVSIFCFPLLLLWRVGSWRILGCRCLLGLALYSPLIITYSPVPGFYQLGGNHHSKSIATPELRAQLKEIVQGYFDDADWKQKTLAENFEAWKDKEWLDMEAELVSMMNCRFWGQPKVSVVSSRGEGFSIRVDWGSSKTGHHGFVISPTPLEDGGGYGAGMMDGPEGPIVFEGRCTYSHWVDDCYLKFDPD